MAALIVLVGIGVVLFIARQPIIESISPMPDDLGVRADGRLKDCPNTPNCVSTQAAVDDAAHYIAPLAFDGSVAAAHDALLAIVAAMPHSTLITDEETYLHFEMRSPTMGFVDDLEISIDAAGGLIHMRSAARLGYDDLNANRRYLMHVRDAFNKTDVAAQTTDEDG